MGAELSLRVRYQSVWNRNTKTRNVGVRPIASVRVKRMNLNFSVDSLDEGRRDHPPPDDDEGNLYSRPSLSS